MSRTRKNKKYTGSHFASNFHAGIKSKSPMFTSENVMKQMLQNQIQETGDKARDVVQTVREKSLLNQLKQFVILFSKISKEKKF